ncbi:MAG: DUF167 domain-containing protein [Candidatus Jorgensenbacteria bacterium]
MTKIFIKAKPNSKTEEVRQIDDNHFTVSVKEPAQEGKANKAILKALAGYLGLPASRLEITSGFSSKTKVIEIG